MQSSNESCETGVTLTIVTQADGREFRRQKHYQETQQTVEIAPSSASPNVWVHPHLWMPRTRSLGQLPDWLPLFWGTNISIKFLYPVYLYRAMWIHAAPLHPPIILLLQ